ncbi:histidinol-phosphate transaminase [Thermodesulforhabdus norvegica]|uniref:Histidinol-phosphate aminotransferase n=1 Tax=Thermodesulforhabdus norvegica TaxID=39841 RepID=A0A1I4QI27_9BACT|nr:histidinol-phosphate transaminase [Thermodesulforhabdus norvegica]SFM39345.1 histidinol phosphate aminotransferase apoenzyme [Thermodesulforhabdus norvegica]
MKVPEHIKKIVPYPPGKPIEELRRELGIPEPVKLASNENPLGPSPRALEALKSALDQVNRYPDGSGYYLRKKISSKLGVPFEGIVLGNGSNEIIEMILKGFTEDGDNILVPQPSFLIYSIVAQIMAVDARPVPLKDFRIDLDAMAEMVDERTRIVVINNPNNPTGTVISRGELERFLEKVPSDLIVVLDEAYIEFVEDGVCPRSTDYIDMEGPWIVGIRTFSKAYGLAGLRIGYSLSAPQVADILNRVRQPFNVNHLAQIAALAALDDEDFLAKTVGLVLEERRGLYSGVEKLGLSYVPSETNFFLIRLPVKARVVYERLLRKGVIARAMDSYGLDYYLRVSVGLPEENRIFLEKLSEVLSELG